MKEAPKPVVVSVLKFVEPNFPKFDVKLQKNTAKSVIFLEH